MSDIRTRVEDALRNVFDPEIPVNVVDLGLVYDIEVGEKGDVKVTMTLTAPACPAAPEILFDAEARVREVEGVTDVHMNLTFDPPWSKERMSEEAKLELGFL